MAEAKSEYLAVNKLKASNKDVSNLMLGNKQVRLAWMNGKRVWDIWSTVLSAVNFNISSSGGNVKDNTTIYSYGTDAIGENHDLEYTINPNAIGATTSSAATTHAVTINQTVTGKSVQITATLAGRVALSTSYGTPTITDTTIGIISASGGTVWLTVYWSQTKTITYDNGTTSSSTVTGSSTATITDGSSSVGAYINGGGIYVPSAGTSYYTSDRVAYTISQFNFTANDVSSGTVSRTVYLYQSANTYSIASYEYSVSASASTSSISAAGGSFTISASCSAREVRSFTSGSTGYGDWFGSGASVEPTSNISSSYPTSFNGSSTITVNVGENTGAARTAIVTIRANDNYYVNKVISVSQSAVSYEFYSNSKSVEVAATIRSVTLTGVSKRNGNALAITSGYVTINSYSVGNPGIESVTTNSNGTFSITVSFDENGDSTAAKYLSITATQPDSGNKINFSITQQKNPVQENYISWMEGMAYYVPGSPKIFTARLLFDSYIERNYIPVTLLSGSTELTTQSVLLQSAEWGSPNPYVDVTMEYDDSGYGPYYMRASYGGDTETIQLVERWNKPYSLRNANDEETEQETENNESV